MLHKLIMALMVCGMLGATLFFTGCRRDSGHHLDPEQVVEKISKKMDLDETQQSRLMEMVTDLEAEVVALHDTEPDPHLAIVEMVRAEQLDTVTLEQLYTSKRDNVDRLAEKVIPYLVEFHALLTPEQRETLANRLEKHGDRRRCRFFNP